MEMSTEEVVDGVAKGEIKLLSSKQVAQMIQKSRSTVDRWVANPSAVTPPFPVPMFVMGISNRWTELQIRDWLTGCVELTKKGT